MSKTDSKLTVFIIDNEASLSVDLKSIIEKSPDRVESLKVFHDPLTAITALRQGMPDVIFLNIESPDYHAIDILRLLPPGTENRVVFITNDEGIGNDAVRLGAREFFVRPVKESDVKIIFDQIELSKKVVKNQNRVYLSNKLLINKLDRTIIINIDDILYLEAHGPYTSFFIVDKTVVKSSKSLGYYINLLIDKTNFIKINRSYVANFEHIKELVRDSNGEGLLILSNQQQIEFSNNSKKKLLHGIQEIMTDSIRS